MLIEVKVKVARLVDDKMKKKTETYLLDKEFFSEAEYAVTEILSEEVSSHLAEDYQILSLKMSPIKEIASQYEGDFAFITTLRDVFLADDGTEKYTRYKLLLWADSLVEANQRIENIVHQGYDMQVEGIQQVDYTYLNKDSNA